MPVSYWHSVSCVYMCLRVGPMFVCMTAMMARCDSQLGFGCSARLVSEFDSAQACCSARLGVSLTLLRLAVLLAL